MIFKDFHNVSEVNVSAEHEVAHPKIQSSTPIFMDARVCRQKAAQKVQEQRRLLVRTGDRSERIRTINFGENRVTDHRIGLTLYGLDNYLSGDKLIDIIQALAAKDEQEQVEEMLAGLAGS
jgi:peptide chain release factor 1